MNFSTLLVIEDMAGRRNYPLAFFTQKESRALARLSKKVKIHAVEIGVFCGGSSVIISKSLPPNTSLTAIDCFVKTKSGLTGSLDCAKYFVRKYGDIKKVNFINKRSEKTAKCWSRPIDFLFIDGDHRYQSVKKDYMGWSPFLVKGGLLIFHDSNKPLFDKDKTYNFGYDGPTRLCNEIKTRQQKLFAFVGSIDSINVFKKL